MGLTEGTAGDALVDEAEFGEADDALHGGFAHVEVFALQGAEGLVDELVDATLVGFLPSHEETGEDVEATQLRQRLVAGYPLEGLVGSEGQMLIEVEGGLLGDFEAGGLLHPNVYDLWKYLIGRHQHRCQYLAFAHVLLPKFQSEVVVLPQPVSHFLEAWQGGSPVQLVVGTLLSHRLGNGPIHHLAERLLDLPYLLPDIHTLDYISVAYSEL